MATNRELIAGAGDGSQAAFLPTIWAKDTRDAIEFEEVLPQLVNTKYEEELRVGRSVQIPLRSNMETQTKTEGFGNTVNFQAVTEDSQTITVSTQQYAAALLNEVVEAQSNYDERQRISHAMGYSLMRGVEVSLATLFASFSQIVGTLGADPDFDVMKRAWQYLADAGVSANASWVLGPAAIAALFGNDKFTSTDFVSGASVIQTAKLTTVFGYPVYRDNLLVAPAAGQTNCGLFHKEAIILIRQIKPTVREQYQIRNLADGLVAFDLYNATEAVWMAEAPAVDSPATQGDFGAVLIRTS